jgi:azurin
MKKYLIVLSASTLSLLMAACGGGEAPKSTTPTEQSAPAQTYEFTINATGNTMADMAYDTKELKVKSGATVTVNLINAGTDETMLHNIVFVKEGTEKEIAMEGLNLKDQNYFNGTSPNVIAGTKVTKPGESVNVVFTAPEPGTYSYICTYPGHWQKMRGILIVE